MELLRNRKRAERRARTRRIVNRQRVILNLFGMVVEWPTFYAKNDIGYQPVSELDTARRIGFCRKRKALDCGKTQCFVCSSRKLDGNKRLRTRMEQLSDVNFREQLEELVSYEPAIDR